MYYRSKYVVLSIGGIELPVIFSDLMTHADVARPLCAQRGEVVSAGFCHINDGTYTCYGESVSLKLKSRPEDSAILNRYLGVTIDD